MPSDIARPRKGRGLFASLASVFVELPGEGRVEATAREDMPGHFEILTDAAPFGRRLFKLVVADGWAKVVEITAATVREAMVQDRGRRALKAHAAQQARKALEEPAVAIVRDPKTKVHVAAYHDDAPTPARRQHDEIVQTVTVEGRERRTVRKVADTLHQLRFRTKTIDVEQYRAGCRFQRSFQAASLSGYASAADLSKPMGLTSVARLPGSGIEDARDVVYDALRAVGGISSLGGGLLWHVVGLGWTVKRFAEEREVMGRRVSQQTAAGALLVSLEALAAHYGYIDKVYEQLGVRPPSDNMLEILTEE